MLYHVWFATRRRKWLLQGDIGPYVLRLIREIAAEKEVAIVELETMVDHVHILLYIEPNQLLSQTVKLLKGISARRAFQTFPDLKLDAQTAHFWQKGFGCRPVSEHERRAVIEYLRTQKARPGKFER
ncbi:MAG: IS200/IS605 family transposase [Chloroflexi bacterium]|nr:IS200/IS605 family transposase [Chloroflexota bacterium]